jgi:hypothetical protein
VWQGRLKAFVVLGETDNRDGGAVAKLTEDRSFEIEGL